MNIKATVRKEYKVRLILIATMCLVWASLCYKDATITYPQQIEAYDTYLQLQKDFPTGWTDMWNQTANEHGWKLNPTERANQDIPTQWYMFWPALLIGIYFLVALARTFGKWIAMEDQVLSTNSVKSVKFEQITNLDKKLWDRKGIAFAHYKLDNDVTGKIKLDDWIFNRSAIRSMIEQLDQYINPQDTSADTEPDQDQD